MPERFKQKAREAILGLCLVGVLPTACAPAVSPTRVLATETRPPTPIEYVTPTQTATATVTETATPTLTRQIEATQTITKPEETIFGKVLIKNRELANARRIEQRSRNPKLYDEQIIAELASLTGPNILMFMCGFNHEPPATYKAKTCANSFFIFRGNEILRITFTHDTRFPEGEIDPSKKAFRSDQLWLGPKGSFDTMRLGWQDATGVPADYVIVVENNNFLPDMVRGVFNGNLKVFVPIEFTALPVWLNENTLSGMKHFSQGTQEMDPDTVLQYLAATPNGQYPPEIENQERIQHILKAMTDEFQKQKFNPLLYVKIADFLSRQISSGNLKTDFEAQRLIISNVRSLGEEIGSEILRGRLSEVGLPQLGKKKYFVSRSAATADNQDQPLEWSDTRLNPSPFVQRNIEMKIYEQGYVEEPINGDALSPRGLIKGYWELPREFTKKWLLFSPN